MEKPHTVASPQVGLRSVARMRMVVVLPAPLGPMNPYTSPRSSLRVSRLSAYRSPYIFVRSRVSIITGSSAFSHRDVDPDISFLRQQPVQRGRSGALPGN